MSDAANPKRPLFSGRFTNIFTPIVIFLLLCFFSVAMDCQDRVGEKGFFYTVSFILTPLIIVLGLLTIVIRIAFKRKPAFIWIAESIIVLVVFMLLSSIT